MKNLFIAALAAFCFSSCNDGAVSADNNDARQKNIAANDVVIKAFETGDVSGIDSVIAPDFIDHTDMGDKKGPDSLKAMISMVRNHFKDMKMEKVREVADDEYVFSWMRYSGTGDGTMGMPKGPYNMNSIEVSKFKDGKAVEHWAFVNAQEMMKMMGNSHDNMSHADTTTAKK